MTVKTATNELEVLDLALDDRGPDGGHRGPDGGRPGGGDEPRPRAPVPQRAYLTGIWLALAGILMFFLALSSAFVVRRGLGGDWQPFLWPRLLWANTAILLLSSFTLERARRLLNLADGAGFRRWWLTTTALGVLFLLGQILAWRELVAAGVYLATNPNSSFFYLLTGAHGLHLLGGLLALLYVGFHRASPGGRVGRSTAVRVAGVYWHFMGGLWVYLFLLLQWGQ